MFSVDEVKIFLTCFCFGVIASFLRDVSSGCLTPLHGARQEEKAWLCYETVFFAAFGIAFTALSANLRFPPLRWYMVVGIVIGFSLYYKFLRIIVAFFKKTCYNIVNKTFRKRKNSEK